MTNTLHEIDGLKNSSIRHNARLEQGVLRTWDGEMKDWKKQSLIVNMESKKRRRGDLLFWGGWSGEQAFVTSPITVCRQG